MDISLKALQDAISIRGQIDTLEKRLSSILGGSAPRPTAPTQGRYFSPATRGKLAAAAKARWARLKTPTKQARAKKKGELTPAGRRRLSQLMKARWAARRKAAEKKIVPARKTGGLSPAGRKKLSDLMKARWAARRKGARPKRTPVRRKRTR